MIKQEAYLIIDIGTGNVRVAITDKKATVLHVERDNVQYVKDERYPDALHFDPDALWQQIMVLAQKALQKVPDVAITAITASSQREGIVLVGVNGESLIGLPNHDHRGREWEDMIPDKHFVYSLTGRYPTSLFSALKLVGIRNRHPEIWQQFSTFMSISDWAQYRLSGVAGYEHSQASETILYDVEQKRWSKELCDIFEINPSVLPPLHASGTVLGNVQPALAETLNLSPDTVVIVGGADTQLAIKSTRPAVDDVVIVSGTTTPIVKITVDYITDQLERTWTNRHCDESQFILEANAGVTGLNYQRLKEIFYPNEGYEVIEKELEATTGADCVASLGSLIAEEKSSLTKGGFVFPTPVSHQLSRASFVRATLWDIACCIKGNYETLCDVTNQQTDFVWACGGGFQSRLLRQLIANLLGKKIYIRSGFQQASVVGGALICSEALGQGVDLDEAIEIVYPQQENGHEALYADWKEVRSHFRKTIREEAVV